MRLEAEMTFYEHGMVGWTLALALGGQREHGWRVAGMAAVAAILPDLDGLSLLAGPSAYAEMHRVWGHNLVAATTGGLLTGMAGYLANLSPRVQYSAAAVLSRLASDVSMSTKISPFAWHDFAVWVLVGVAAGLSHLPADLVFSGAADLPPWPIPLLWPFSEQRWQMDIVPWGDPGPTVILVAEMFALYRWPGRSQAIAGLTLLLLVGYIGLRWLVGGAVR